MNSDVKKLITEIKSMKWMDNHGEINPEWVIFSDYSDADNASFEDTERFESCDTYESSYSSALAAVLNKHMDSCDVVYITAQSFFWRSANVSRSCSYSAACDAQLLARCLIAFADQPDSPHLAHAKARWAVWQAGYGLLCDIGGDLYVYQKV